MLPSVTQIISFCNPGAFAGVAPEVLAAACRRGTALHSLFAAYALELPTFEVPPELEGYFTSYQRWFDDMVVKVILAEEQVTHPTLGYTGTPDLVCQLKGDGGLALGDDKSSAVFSKGWRLQTSAYRDLVEKAKELYIPRTFSLQPRVDGSRAVFREYTRSLSADFAVFQSCLQVWRFWNAE